MNKKANTPIAIAILTLAFFMVIGFAWYTFLTKSGEVELYIQSPYLLEEIYAKESPINTHIGSLVHAAGRQITEGTNIKEKFIENLRFELEKNEMNERYITPELEQLRDQLLKENINLEEKNLTIPFTITINGLIEDEGYEIISAEYTYTKNFKTELEIASLDCRAHFSGIGLSDKYYFDEDNFEFGSSRIWEEDEHSHILTEGEYPSMQETIPRAAKEQDNMGIVTIPTLDAVALAEDVKLTVYSEENFGGEILAEVSGPLLIYSKDHKNRIEFIGEYITSQWPEPLQSQFPNEKRIFSDQSMRDWETGSMKIEC